jgi:hypothetical protein
MERQHENTAGETLEQLLTLIQILGDTMDDLEMTLVKANKEPTQESRNVVAYTVFRDFNSYSLLLSLIEERANEAIHQLNADS